MEEWINTDNHRNIRDLINSSITHVTVRIPEGRQDLANGVKELFLEENRQWMDVVLTNVGSLLKTFIEPLVKSPIELLTVKHERISHEEEGNTSNTIGYRNLSNEDDAHFWPIFSRALALRTSHFRDCILRTFPLHMDVHN